MKTETIDFKVAHLRNFDPTSQIKKNRTFWKFVSVRNVVLTCIRLRCQSLDWRIAVTLLKFSERKRVNRSHIESY